MFRTLSGPKPNIPLPKDTVDTHLHIFNSRKYADQPGGPPAPVDALISHYQQVQEWLGMERMVLVQGNAYQKDNSAILEGLDHFGDKARGIAAVDANITDEELEGLTARGVRGARIMDIWQGAVGLDEAIAVNERVLPFGWSLITQFDGCQILDHKSILEKIKGDYVIDHMGKFLDPVSPDSAEFKCMLDLVDRGNCYVKIAACYETSKSGAPSYEDVGILSRAMIKHAPERVIWATNWPHNSATTKESYPDDLGLLNLSMEWMETDENRQKILVDNPSRLYGFK